MLLNFVAKDKIRMGLSKSFLFSNCQILNGLILKCYSFRKLTFLSNIGKTHFYINFFTMLKIRLDGKSSTTFLEAVLPGALPDRLMGLPPKKLFFKNKLRYNKNTNKIKKTQ